MSLDHLSSRVNTTFGYRTISDLPRLFWPRESSEEGSHKSKKLKRQTSDFWCERSDRHKLNWVSKESGFSKNGSPFITFSFMLIIWITDGFHHLLTTPFVLFSLSNSSFRHLTIQVSSKIFESIQGYVDLSVYVWVLSGLYRDLFGESDRNSEIRSSFTSDSDSISTVDRSSHNFRTRLCVCTCMCVCVCRGVVSDLLTDQKQILL